jgi:hypothetical protein
MRPELIPQAPAAAKGRNRSLLPIILGGSLVVALLGGGLLVWLGRDQSATTVPSVPAAAVFCDALKSIIAEGPTKFVSLLGPEHSASRLGELHGSGLDLSGRDQALLLM